MIILAMIAAVCLICLYIRNGKNGQLDNFVSSLNEDLNTVSDKKKPIDSLNLSDELSDDDKEWYFNHNVKNNYFSSKGFINNIKQLGNDDTDLAMAYTTAIQIGEAIIMMMASSKLGDKEDYIEAYQMRNKAAKDFIELNNLDKIKCGLSEKLDDGQSILYAEFDGFAFATYVSFNERMGCKGLPTNMKEVQVDNFMPSLEKHLRKKFDDGDEMKVILRRYSKVRNVKNEAVSSPFETLSQTFG